MPVLCKQKGFTLIELLVAITLIAILAVAGGGAYMRSIQRGRDGKAIAEVKEIQKSLELFYSITGNYPTGLNDGVFNDKKYFASGSVPNGDFTYNNASSGFCLCVELETETGNATTDCTGIPTGEYFCVENSQ